MACARCFPSRPSASPTREPNLSSVPTHYGRITKIVLAVLITTALGFIGTAGLLHSSGAISLPSALNWISSIGTIGHGCMIAGAGLGVLVIIKQARNYQLEKTWERSSPEHLAGSADPAIQAEQKEDAELTWRILSDENAAPFAQIQDEDSYTTRPSRQIDGHTVIFSKDDGKIVCCRVRNEDLQRTLGEYGLTKLFPFPESA